MEGLHGHFKSLIHLLHRPSYILPVIIFAQFAGTSLWFAGNAVLSEIQIKFHLDQHAVSSITTAVQLGFISGTFVFAFLSIADNFRPSVVFFISSLIAAVANLSVIAVTDAKGLLLMRFLTGFFLAGIYPVGMKIASDWFEKGLGKALGYLVGALVLGTAFPHLLKGDFHLPWKQLMIFTTAFAMAGGLAILLIVPDGPYRKRSTQFRPGMMVAVFKSPGFRSAAFGYFGHMWELYTFWAFVPLLVQLHNQRTGPPLNVPLTSFITIAVGSLGCVIGGWLSGKLGSARIAFYALACSGLCCVFSPWLIHIDNTAFVIFLMIWGTSVVADSPQFSALVAATAPPQLKGTALTIVTSIGFAITILSIFLLDRLLHRFDFSTNLFVILSLGPVLGLITMRSLLSRHYISEKPSHV